MKKIKIAIDTGPLTSGDSVRGIGVYTRELLNSLNSLQKENKDNFEICPIDFFGLQSSTIYHYDVVHFTRFNPFKLSVPLSKPKNTKFVLTIYDLIPLIYPEHYPSGARGWVNWQINKFLIKNNIDKIITISETSKKDICRFIGIDPKKVTAIHLAPRPIFRKLEVGNWSLEIVKQYNLPKRFGLYVGDINYNKNIPLLIKAAKSADIPLVIAGKQALELEKMNLEHPELKHLKNVNFDNVIRTGFVTDDDLVKIYNLAEVYIQPSLYEGFGLPLLEAQACSIPVIAAKTQALVEIAEDSAIFADYKNPSDFAEKIKSMIEDSSLKNKLIEHGLKNVKKYSWKITAEQTLKIYNK